MDFIVGIGKFWWSLVRVECLIVATQVGRHMGVWVAGNIGVGVDACSGRAPVWCGGSKEIGGGDRHGWRVW